MSRQQGSSAPGIYDYDWCYHPAQMRSKPLLCLATVLAALLPASAQRAPSAKAVQRIQKQVRHEILMLPYFDVFDNIAYKVDGYNVTLLGAVTRPTLKSDAERAVKKIEGIEQVINKIEVIPPSPADDSLRRTLYHAIYGYPSLQRYALPPIKPIRIIVKNGDVDLQGVVDSNADKNLVYIRARGVPGIFSVTNNLVVAK